MKVIVMVEAAGADEQKLTPTEAMFKAMGAYNEELVKAGVMVDGEGLTPSARGARVVFDGDEVTVVDGPFTETKELVAGFWIWEVDSLEEAVEWAKRCPSDPDAGIRSMLEIRPLATVEDFGDAYTPEVAEQEQRLVEALRAQRGA